LAEKATPPIAILDQKHNRGTPPRALQQDPTLLTFVGSVLGLAWQPNPTTLGPAAM